MRRCFARHPNRKNPYLGPLFLGFDPGKPDPVTQGRSLELVTNDAATYLEGCRAGSFSGFALSNILDGAEKSYRERLFAAVRRAAQPSAVAVLRSFGEPPTELPTNQAAADRSLLWGLVDVRPVEALGD
jgi:hypothetical protein